MATKIKEGDVVQLNSGGHRMTVSHLTDDGQAVCTWHDEGGKPQTHLYPIAGLTKVENPEAPPQLLPKSK